MFNVQKVHDDDFPCAPPRHYVKLPTHVEHTVGRLLVQSESSTLKLTIGRLSGGVADVARLK